MKLQLLLPWNVCILWAFNTLPGAAGSKGAIPVFINTSVQFSSVTQSCPILCDPMDHSTPGLPVRYQLPEFTETHIHQVGDAIQPSHPLWSPSPSASVLPMNIQDWFPLGWTGWISLQSQGLSRVFSNNTVQKHQFFGAHTPIQKKKKNNVASVVDFHLEEIRYSWLNLLAVY